MSLVMLGLIEFSALKSHNYADAQHGMSMRSFVRSLTTISTDWTVCVVRYALLSCYREAIHRAGGLSVLLFC